MEFLNQIIYYFVAFLPSAIMHEYAHGWMAEHLGDHTARYAGRLTLDPRRHIDMWGTILLPLMLLVLTGGSFVFGYAIPVPFNPFNLKNQRWGPALVGFAGPLSNFLLALVLGVTIRFVPDFMVQPLGYIIYVNILLMVFNLVPIPPLDGSKILYAILPANAYGVKVFLDRYGFMILLFFMFFLFESLSPIINALFNLIVR